MSGIIELWRKDRGLPLPVRFVVGNQPELANGTLVESIPPVSKIELRETGSIAGKRITQPVFCISFEESFVERYIPLDEMIEVAYETKAKNTAKATVPALPQE